MGEEHKVETEIFRSAKRESNSSFKEQLYIKSVTLAAKGLKLCIKAILYMENMLNKYQGKKEDVKTDLYQGWL